jgi:TolA-binding protein
MKSFYEFLEFSSLPKSLVAAGIAAASFLSTGATETFAQADKKFSDDQIATALTYKAKQPGVDYDFKVQGKPSAEQVKNAQMQASAQKFGKSGYVLADSTNRVIRVLLDSNKDRKLDYFSYYKDGVEVYREVDTDYDTEPNEYRWMGSAGTRWGIDRNQDGEIDQWKVISAEEVAYEVFMAIKNRDDSRYMRLLMTNEEFRSLGLTGDIAKDAAARLDKARKGFAAMVRGQKTINESAKWINSGNGQPSLAPAGSGLSKDLICHDHASSVFQSSAGTDTLALGTLVKIGDVWRLMELPQVVPRGKAIENGGLLFPVVQIIPEMGDEGGPAVAYDEALAGLYEDLTKLETAIDEEKDPGTAMIKLQKDRAMLQWKIYQKIPKNEQANWLENIGDTVSNAYQSDMYPEGLKFLGSVIKTLRDNKKTDSLDYIRFRMITAEYYKKTIDRDKRGDEEAADEYYEALEKFAKEFPNSKFAPEALFLIGQNFEVNSRVSDLEKAKQFYRSCSQKYPKTSFGIRAKGALIRLSGIGKPVPFQGTTVDGKKFDISNRTLRNRIIVVYYWDKWSAKQEMNQKGDTAFDVFQDLKSKFKDEVIIVSANIENDSTDYDQFKGKLKGVFEMHESGGMETSPLATQLGVVSVPLMVVWDKKGNMVDAESSVADLERIIQKLRK